jgi:PAS domain S-box-containing protein
MHLDILNAMPDAVVVSDRDGRLQYVNRMTCELFGYEEASLVGRPVDVLLPMRYRLLHGAHRDAYAAAPRARPMGVGLDLLGLKKDGTEFPVDISLAPFSLGGDACVVVAIRDITERRRMEQRERQLKQAEEEVRHRDEMLAIASHELRAPVGSLQLQVGVLYRTAGAAVTELNTMRDRMGGAAAELTAMRERMGKVERHSRRLARLIQELLDVSNTSFGEMPLKLEDADLAELTREAVDGLRDDVERTGSAVKLEADAPVPGRWDPVRMEQIIANLVMNAAKFGEGKPITVRVDGDGLRARVTVTDQGVGIAAKDQERIFERFERAALAGTVGLGLGLYIARRLVEAHGGAIRLQSTVGVGSTFTVDVPRATSVTT